MLFINITTLDDLNKVSPEDAILFLSECDQNLVDEFYENNDTLVIKNFVVRRAFIKRWRFEKIDYGFWLNEYHERRIKAENKKKKKLP